MRKFILAIEGVRALVWASFVLYLAFWFVPDAGYEQEGPIYARLVSFLLGLPYSLATPHLPSAWLEAMGSGPTSVAFVECAVWLIGVGLVLSALSWRTGRWQAESRNGQDQRGGGVR